MKELINVLKIILFFSLSSQIKYKKFKIGFSIKIKNKKEIEPFFLKVRQQLSSFISVSTFSRRKIININTPKCEKVFKAYNISKNIDFKIKIIKKSKNYYVNDEELKYEICQIENYTFRPISGYIIWNNKLIENNIDKKVIEKKIIHTIFHLLGFNEHTLILKKLFNNNSKRIIFF